MRQSSEMPRQWVRTRGDQVLGQSVRAARLVDGAWLEEEVQWRLVSALCLIPSACREMSGLVLDMLLLPWRSVTLEPGAVSQVNHL